MSSGQQHIPREEQHTSTHRRDLARTQQKGGGGLAFLTFLAFHCNHIKLNSAKNGGRRKGG